MVTGTGVRADAEGAEPIVKKAIAHSAIAAEMNLLCRIINIPFFFVNGWFEVMTTFLLQRDCGGGAARNRKFFEACVFRAMLLVRGGAAPLGHRSRRVEG